MTVLVTGGGGFLGGAIVRQLLQRGTPVRSFTRSPYPWLAELGVEQCQGDLANAADVERAVEGCDAVIHTAAKAGVWGRFKDYYSTNVVGTKNLLKAVARAGIAKFVFTSTPSVVHHGGHIAGGNESLPYPKRYAAFYPETKALAERAVIAANSPTLCTVSLRPHLIFGPGDPHLIPRVLARGRTGKLRRIGTEPVVVDVTYIDNAAEAHLLALDRAAPGHAVAGRCYFISNGEPVPLWDFLNRVLAGRGLPPVRRKSPAWLAHVAAALTESLYRLLRLSAEPPLTRFVVEQLSTSHWYDISAARRELSYIPRIGVDEGLRRMLAHAGLQSA